MRSSKASAGFPRRSHFPNICITCARISTWCAPASKGAPESQLETLSRNVTRKGTTHESDTDCVCKSLAVPARRRRRFASLPVQRAHRGGGRGAAALGPGARIHCTLARGGLGQDGMVRRVRVPVGFPELVLGTPAA